MFHRHLPCFIHVIASNLRTLYQDVSLKKNPTFGPKTTSSTEASILLRLNNPGYYTFQGVIHTTNCSQTWLMINIFILKKNKHEIKSQLGCWIPKPFLQVKALIYKQYECMKPVHCTLYPSKQIWALLNRTYLWQLDSIFSAFNHCGWV